MVTWFGVVFLVIAAVIALLYNRLVRSRNRVNTAWSDIDVQLQRRHDLVPNLVEAVRIYAKYEKATIKAVTRLRAEALGVSDVDKLGALENQLSAGLHRLIALVEDYPDLQADQNFARLQDQLVETENLLQFARRYYNGAVRNYNTIIETVPSNIVSAWFKFRPRAFFQKSSDKVGQTPRVQLDTSTD